MLPRIGEPLPKTCQEGDQTSNEDCVSASKILVKWVRQPTTNGETAKVRRRVDKASNPFPILNSKLLKKEEICSIDNGFIFNRSRSRQSYDIGGKGQSFDIPIPCVAAAREHMTTIW